MWRKLRDDEKTRLNYVMGILAFIEVGILLYVLFTQLASLYLWRSS